MHRQHRNLSLLLTVACLLTNSTVLPAEAANGKWHLRAHVAWVYPDLDWQTSPEPGSVIKVVSAAITLG